MHALHPHPRAWPLGRANFQDQSEGRKPKADPMAKRNPVIPGPTHLSRTVRFVTTCRPNWNLSLDPIHHWYLVHGRPSCVGVLALPKQQGRSPYFHLRVIDNYAR